MSIFEYDEELHMQQEREAAREDGIEDGRELGREKGEEKILSLIHRMSEEGLTQDIPRLSIDKAFRQTVCEKYKL